MKVYDIALAIVRTLVAFDLIRETATLIFTGLRATLLLSSPAVRGMEMAAVGSAVLQILALLVALALSRQIARFGSKLAAPTDAAMQF